MYRVPSILLGMARWEWTDKETDVPSQCPEYWEINKHGSYGRKEDPCWSFGLSKGCLCSHF